MKFKTRADVVKAVLRKGLENKDRAFGRELHKYERYYRERTGYSWMAPDIYTAARVSNEFYVTNLYGLLGLEKENVTPEVRSVIFRAAVRYFGRAVGVNENIVYRSKSNQLEMDKTGLRKEVAKVARQKLEILMPSVTRLKSLAKE